MTEVLIVAISCGFVLLLIRMIIRASYREKELKLAAKAGGPDADGRFRSHESEIASLKDRVAVLERLLTDDDRKLASEIERLKSVAPSAQV
jgi:hypothetical protein